MRIFDAIALLLSRVAARRTRSVHSAGSPGFARAARRTCAARRAREAGGVKL